MIDGLGQRLKIARMQKKLSRKQVAEIIGVTASLIGMYETDERLPSLLVFEISLMLWNFNGLFA